MTQSSETTADQTPGTEPAKSTGKRPTIEVIGMHKWYSDFHVLRDINLKVADGERIVIAGPSGSGKSTLIRCINRGSMRCGAKWGWCSSTSICSRT